MYRFSFIAVCFFILTIDLFAQLSTLIYEPFDNNRRHWLVVNNSQEKISIKDGKLNWIRKDKEAKFIWQKFDLDLNNDFEITSKIESTTIGEFGLVWGGRDGNNAFCFTIKNGQFQIAEIRNGQWKYLKTYEKFASEQQELYNFKIVKAGPTIEYYINDLLLFETPFLGIMGNKFGFASFSPTNLKIDQLKIKLANTGIASNANFIFNDPVSLPDMVNSSYDELAPVVNYTGDKLYFSRRNYSKNIGSEKDDIYCATQNASGKWENAINVGPPFNNEFYNYVCSVLPGDTTFLLANAYSNETNPLSQGVCWGNTNKDAGGFQQPILIKDFYSLNSKNDFSVAQDKQAMLMAVERRDGLGKNDLYVSIAQDGVWREPINLGKIINTTQDELCPFLSPDLHTLYFSSRGHAGLGEADIFMSTRLDNSWTKWSTPINLGSPINTEFFDGYFNFAPFSNVAYFISETENKNDIFSVVLPEPLRYKSTTTMQGTITDIDDNKLLVAELSFKTLLGNQLKTFTAEDGKYSITVPRDSAVVMSISTLDYHTTFDTILPKKEVVYGSNFRETRDFKMKKNLLAKKLLLHNILFDRGSVELNNSSYPELDKLYALLLADNAMSIEIRGHTDNQGDPQLNINLSQSRANTIKNYLVRKGIADNRISAKGLGGSYPISSNNNEYTRKLNRRVEVVVLSAQGDL